MASADPGGTPLPSKPVPALASPALAYQTVACDPRGTTSLDAALATSLNSQLRADMRGYMNAYRTSCARMIVNAAKARGLAQRAAVIAVTTAIVETHLQNISEEVDHTSLGLFQQQEWWGSRAQRLNATWATNKFLSVMESKYPNRSWMTAPIGEVCQTVQVSAYPDRYQVQAGDAQIIVNALWDGAGTAAPALMRDDGDGTMTLWRWSSSGSS
ncbi:VCBS repeat-containing protein, partial [Micromonospora sp. DT41]